MPALHKLQYLTRNTLISARDLWQGKGLGGIAFRRAMANAPLQLDAQTYNAGHPDYRPEMVRNYPWRLYNTDCASDNELYGEFKAYAQGDKISRRAWLPLLKAAYAEARTVPGFDDIMQGKTFIENVMAELSHTYQAHYIAGWINMLDAQFLYRLVRRMKPKTVVQTGVCNGVSSAFIMLALAKNGPEGKLYTVDMPTVFNADDPAWKKKGEIYGTVIPQGKTSGWLVPKMYKDRFSVDSGDAKELLPKLIDRLDSVDMFYHDSDHSYQHMVFEFEQAKRKLTPGGIIAADDISWNTSLWDFADRNRLPAYNFHGTIGLAFMPKNPR